METLYRWQDWSTAAQASQTKYLLWFQMWQIQRVINVTHYTVFDNTLLTHWMRRRPYVLFWAFESDDVVMSFSCVSICCPVHITVTNQEGVGENIQDQPINIGLSCGTPDNGTSSLVLLTLQQLFSWLSAVQTGFPPCRPVHNIIIYLLSFCGPVWVDWVLLTLWNIAPNERAQRTLGSHCFTVVSITHASCGRTSSP